IQIIGLTTWQVMGSTVNLTVQQVNNVCDLGASGSLRLDLWATATPYGGGTIDGYRFGTVSLNPLPAGYVYNNINRTVPYAKPPDGSYYVTLTLSEYHNGSYFIVDYINYSPHIFGYPPAVPRPAPATGVTTYGFTANWVGAAGATGYALDVSTDILFG